MNTKAIIGVDPKLPYAIEEAINRLRINVSFFGTDIRKIMIVSSEPNEGKSFIAMSLWKQMALAGEKTIFVDCDMRKSVLVEQYQIEREDGKNHELIRFYVTDDNNHIPVRLDMFLSFGSAKAFLKTYKGVRGPMTSKIK